jgi:hypothetical protein
MEITTRALWTTIHGMGFGALYLLACSGAVVELWRHFAPREPVPVSAGDERFLRIYLAMMTLLAWLAVLTGAYMIYPWYRAAPPAGTANLAAFPQRLLMSSPATIGWHSIGMEWKEHVAWLVPISISMASGVLFKYGGSIKNHPALRNGVLSFVVVSFLAAGIAGFFGAMINKAAPVQGGATIHRMRGGESR